MEQNTLRSYALALLMMLGNQQGANGNSPPLGWALNRETQRSRFNLAAHRLLSALLEHSPSPETVAQQFMTALAQCENPAVINLGNGFSTLSDTFHIEYYSQVNSLDNDRSVSPGDWATAVSQGLSQNGNISALRDLSVVYLNDLVIPCRSRCKICWLVT